MKPFFSHNGSKRRVLHKILPLIPKHKIYVEPFIGSASVLLGKPPSELEVINDLDKQLMKAYKLLKQATPAIINYMPDKSIESIQALVDKKTKNKNILLLQELYKRTATFQNQYNTKIYKTNMQEDKLKNILQYTHRLKDVQLYSTDYKNLIHHFDSPETFFFLDPPYENSKGLYKNHLFDFEQLSEILKSIKGKFLLTLNDSPTIRKIFKGFKIKKMLVPSIGGINTVGTKDRKELIITNY